MLSYKILRQTSLDEAKRILKIQFYRRYKKVILEYHELGQIWILDNQERFSKLLPRFIIKFQ